MNLSLRLGTGITLPNRLMKSASSSGLHTEQHYPTERCLQLYTRIARAKPGLMVLEDAFVHPLGQYKHPQLSLASDSCIEAHKVLLQAIRQVSPETKIFAQLGHAGDKGSLPVNDASQEQLDELPQCYKRAALRARSAGYDGVYLHAGHTNLISRTLSSAFNRRQDKYQCGDTFLNAVLEELAQLALEFPIAIKLQAEEFMENGLGITVNQTVERIRGFAFPFCFIELCGGTTDSRSYFMAEVNKKQDYYYRNVVLALYKANLLQKYIIGVTGGMKDMQTAELALADGCSLVGFCRYFIRDESFAQKCLRCNKCADKLLETGDGTCVMRRAGV